MVRVIGTGGQRLTPRAGRRVGVLDRVLGVVGEIFITLGVLLLLFVAWQLWWTDVVAGQAQAAITDRLRSGWSEPLAGNQPPPGDPIVAAAPEQGNAFAVLHVPRFGSDWAPRSVLEGTSLKILEEGFGHYPETVMPGAVGNFAVAGHRVTYGRPMWQVEELQPGDAIVVETADGWYTYRVSDHKIVSPRDVEVIAPVPGQPDVTPTERMLTITACHPKYSARERYIVHATFDEWQPRSYGEPDSLARPQGVQ